MNRSFPTSFQFRAWLVGAIGLVAVAYLPGLSGGFLFDDFVNLASLGAHGRIDNPLALLYYLTSGIADPTGRPVSVASFLLDARDWPAEPYPFKRTNLLLHLANGVLLVAVLLRLEHRLGTARSEHLRRRIALLAGFLWLAHPLFVSTTLYVVQRHAMLPFTFAMLALLSWDRAVHHHALGMHARGWFWGVIGTGVAALLAGLSKANGFLVPLLVLAVACVAYPSQIKTLTQNARRAIRWNLIVALVLPSMLVVSAIIARAPSSLDFAGSRSFTLGERLLTQPRALMDYLGLLLLPRSGGGGVFVEGFPKSTGLWEPWTTLPSIVCVLLLMAGAVRIARREPALSIAALFFLLAHLMESSVIMLELYFEHRNYLPAAFLFWPVARLLVLWRPLPRLRGILSFAIPAVFLLLTWQRAQVWGDPVLLAQLSASENPDSRRALMTAATELSARGKATQAADLLTRAITLHGVSTDLTLNLLGAECRAAGVSSATLELVEASLEVERRWHKGVISWLGSAIEVAASGDCKGLDLSAAARFIEAAMRSPSAMARPSALQNILHLEARLALASGKAEQALERFDIALASRPNPDTAMTQAALLGEAGFPALGIRHLDSLEAHSAGRPTRLRNMQDLHARLLHDTGYYDRELAHLRASLIDYQRELAVKAGDEEIIGASPERRAPKELPLRQMPPTKTLPAR